MHEMLFAGKISQFREPNNLGDQMRKTNRIKPIVFGSLLGIVFCSLTIFTLADRMARADDDTHPCECSTGGGNAAQDVTLTFKVEQFNRMTLNSKVKTKYVVQNGYAVIEGDLEVGKADVIATKMHDYANLGPEGVVVLGKLWKGRELFYRIDDSVKGMAPQIQSAFQIWALAGFKSTLYTNQPDFITFEKGASCGTTSIGRCGGEQFIHIGKNCQIGDIAHEIGHAIGLLHEHTRLDRDQFVIYHPENTLAGFTQNFDKHDSKGVDGLSKYDPQSIMHYGKMDFAKDPNDKSKPTLESKTGDSFGQRKSLSTLDIETVNKLYQGE